MWFDVQAALKKIEGGLVATSATSATFEAEKPKNLPRVADVASVATLHPSQNTQHDSPDIDALDQASERAAIMEYDAGLPRAAAERAAALAASKAWGVPVAVILAGLLPWEYQAIVDARKAEAEAKNGA